MGLLTADCKSAVRARPVMKKYCRMLHGKAQSDARVDSCVMSGLVDAHVRHRDWQR